MKCMPMIKFNRKTKINFRPSLHYDSYLYQLLVQVTNLAFDFPRQVGK